MGGSAQGVHALVAVRSNSIFFMLSSMYASPKYAIRKDLWDE